MTINKYESGSYDNEGIANEDNELLLDALYEINK